MKTEAWEIWESLTIHFVSEEIPLLTKNVLWGFFGLAKQTMGFSWLEIILFFFYFFSQFGQRTKKKKGKKRPTKNNKWKPN